MQMIPRGNTLKPEEDCNRGCHKPHHLLVFIWVGLQQDQMKIKILVGNVSIDKMLVFTFLQLCPPFFTNEDFYLFIFKMRMPFGLPQHLD